MGFSFLSPHPLPFHLNEMARHMGLVRVAQPSQSPQQAMLASPTPLTQPFLPAQLLLPS